MKVEPLNLRRHILQRSIGSALGIVYITWYTRQGWQFALTSAGICLVLIVAVFPLFKGVSKEEEGKRSANNRLGRAD